MSDLADTITECFRVMDQMKADGATKAERLAFAETAIRHSWPYEREWKFLCATCRDYGLEMFDCPGDATCGRHKAHLPHEFGKPCWCSVGAKFRQKTRTADDDVTSAAKTPKPSKFTRAGRY